MPDALRPSWPRPGPQRQPRAAPAAASATRERIVHVETSDGLILDGALIEPAVRKGPAILWLHGLHLAFSAPEYMALARALAGHGVTMLSANTRGHDFGTWLRGRGGPLLAGSGWERFQDCRRDVEAWLGLLQLEGFSHMVLAGHGYGATKAVYATVRSADPRILAVIAASAGSLIREAISLDDVTLAEECDADGRGADLLPWGRSPTRTTGASTTFSAQVILNRARLQRELYGTEELPPLLAQLAVPLMAFFGSEEQRPGRDVQGFLDTIRRNAVRSPSIQTTLIPEAGYFYTGAEAAIAAALARWLTMNVPQTATPTAIAPQDRRRTRNAT